MALSPDIVDMTVDLNDKAEFLASIYDIHSEANTLFLGIADQTANLIDIIELKRHSSDHLDYIYEYNDREPAYLSVPKSPAALGYNRKRILGEVEEDTTYMRGYLRLSDGSYMSVLEPFFCRGR
jgi:hypothetical protein